jgi:polysaccharide export outer membrane protein
MLALTLLATACGGRLANQETLEQVAAAEYRLGPGDQLRISVFGEEELSGQFVVSSQGTISYPLIGETAAAGLSISEFTQSLVDTLRNGYVRQPSVSVEVTNYRPFYILGEVSNPGTYPYSAGLTVMNAVATAGGFTYRADDGPLYIKHAREEDERAYRLNSTTPVQPGDTVRIPERRF